MCMLATVHSTRISNSFVDFLFYLCSVASNVCMLCYMFLFFFMGMKRMCSAVTDGDGYNGFSVMGWLVAFGCICIVIDMVSGGRQYCIGHTT